MASDSRVKIVFQGKEYASLDELPPEVRDALAKYEQGDGAKQQLVARIMAGDTSNLAGADNVTVRVTQKTRRVRPANTPVEWAYGLGTLAFIFASFFVMVFEGDYVQNTFNGTRMILIAALAGVIVGLTAAPPVVRRLPLKGSGVWLYRALLTLACMSFTVALASRTNRAFASSPPETWRATVVEKIHHKSAPRSPESWNLVLQTGSWKGSVIVGRRTFDSVQAGGTFEGQVQRGFWGYTYLLPGGHGAP